jgi:hypothetical protein
MLGDLIPNRLTPEKAELVGALMGDKGTFKVQRRHGFYRGYDLSKYTRCAMSICLGKDREWGDHLSALMSSSFNVHGSTYLDGREWRFWSSSSRAFRDLAQYYSPDWNCRLWRVGDPFFEAQQTIKEGLVRGYFDADGYPNLNKARQEVSVKAVSVNLEGVRTMKELLSTIGYEPKVYRRYSNADVWELCMARQSDVVRFYECIGFSIERKQRALEFMLREKGLLS